MNYVSGTYILGQALLRAWPISPSDEVGARPLSSRPERHWDDIERVDSELKARQQHSRRTGHLLDFPNHAVWPTPSLGDLGASGALLSPSHAA